MIGFTIVAAIVVCVSAQGEDPLEALANNIPGVPGEDYPIFAEPPQTAFLCDPQIQGYYADPDADCQSFHICADNGNDGLTKYSFLCPNGTLFNQQYFICDWWFNVDCSLAESLYTLNADVAAAAAAATAEGGAGRRSRNLGDVPVVEGFGGNNDNRLPTGNRNRRPNQ